MKFLLLLLATVGFAFGQNPTIVRTTNGLTNQTGRIAGNVTVGIITNGAAVGDVLTFTNGTWMSAAPTGGGSVFNPTNAYIFITNRLIISGLATFTNFGSMSISNVEINGTINNSGWPIFDFTSMQWKLVGGQTSIDALNRRLIDSTGVQAIGWEAHTTTPPWTNLSSLTVLGVFTTGSNTVLGANAASTVTDNGTSTTIPNGKSFGGRFDMNADGTNYMALPFMWGAKGSGTRYAMFTNSAGSLVLTNLNGTTSQIWNNP